MNIGISLLTVELDQLGGLNLRIGALIRGLAQLGFQVTVIQTTQALDNSKNFYNSVSQLPVKPFQVDFLLRQGRMIWTSLPSLWRLPVERIIPNNIEVLDLWDPLINVPDQRDYRVIFSHNHFTPYIWEHFRACGIRSIPMFMEIPFLHMTLKGYGKQIEAFITETEDQRKWMMKRYNVPVRSITAIPPGYDRRLIDRLSKPNMNYKSPPFIIIFSGRVVSWKGVYELLEAYSLLAPKFPQWNLHLVGDGLAAGNLQNKVKEKGLQDRVVFWGRKSYEEALAIVSKADIFISPSYIETFGMSLLEAMALGLPVIATRVGGIKDYLIQDKTTGLLIPRKNIKALFDALFRLITDVDLRINLGSKAKEKVEYFTNDNFVKSTLDVYKSTLEKTHE